RAQASTSSADLRNDPGISSGSAENSSSGRTSIKTGPVGIPTKRTSPQMPLSDSAIRVLKPRVTAYKVSDEKGLCSSVTPAGGRLWKSKFRTATGVEKKSSLGSYPDLSSKEARNRRDEARRNLANGIDPAEKKRRD
ncbi:hypothetical protein OY671_008276, partial [Metschnikowia pulcherrima]